MKEWSTQMVQKILSPWLMLAKIDQYSDYPGNWLIALSEEKIWHEATSKHALVKEPTVFKDIMRGKIVKLYRDQKTWHKQPFSYLLIVSLGRDSNLMSFSITLFTWRLSQGLLLMPPLDWMTTLSKWHRKLDNCVKCWCHYKMHSASSVLWIYDSSVCHLHLKNM